MKRSGVTKGNGTWFCNEGGCTLDEPPHAEVSNARGKVNIIVLGNVAANMLELTCPSGYRERADIVDHTAVFYEVPVDLCQLHFKGGSPAKFNGIQPGKTYKCSVAGTQAVCNPYDG